MGLDVSAHLVYGIKLPEEFKISDDESYLEKLDNIFYPYKKEAPYPNLDLVHIGNCDEPEVIVVCKNKQYSVYWTAEPIDITKLNYINLNELDELEEFCKNHELIYDPKWYFGCYCSY
jgi:hypothetical protein